MGSLPENGIVTRERWLILSVWAGLVISSLRRRRIALFCISDMFFQNVKTLIIRSMCNRIPFIMFISDTFNHCTSINIHCTKLKRLAGAQSANPTHWFNGFHFFAIGKPLSRQDFKVFGRLYDSVLLGIANGHIWAKKNGRLGGTAFYIKDADTAKGHIHIFFKGIF